jgi:hypothetical protein
VYSGGIKVPICNEKAFYWSVRSLIAHHEGSVGIHGEEGLSYKMISRLQKIYDMWTQQMKLYCKIIETYLFNIRVLMLTRDPLSDHLKVCRPRQNVGKRPR